MNVAASPDDSAGSVGPLESRLSHLTIKKPAPTKQSRCLTWLKSVAARKEKPPVQPPTPIGLQEQALLIAVTQPPASHPLMPLFDEIIQAAALQDAIARNRSLSLIVFKQMLLLLYLNVQINHFATSFMISGQHEEGRQHDELLFSILNFILTDTRAMPKFNFPSETILTFASAITHILFQFACLTPMHPTELDYSPASPPSSPNDDSLQSYTPPSLENLVQELRAIQRVSPATCATPNLMTTDEDRAMNLIFNRDLYPTSPKGKYTPFAFGKFKTLLQDHATLIEHILIINTKMLAQLLREPMFFTDLEDGRGTQSYRHKTNPTHCLATYRKFEKIRERYKDIIPGLERVLDRLWSAAAEIPKDGFKDYAATVVFRRLLDRIFIEERWEIGAARAVPAYRDSEDL